MRPSSSARSPSPIRRPRRTSPRGATSRSCAPTPRAPPPGTASASSCASCSPRRVAARRARPPRRRRAGPQRARRRTRTAACARSPPTSARRSPPGLVFRAIGYRGIPLPGVPFDERSAVIPNDGGPRARSRQRRADPRRVRRRLDQARPLRRDRHEQEGRAGDRRRDARRPRAAEQRRAVAGTAPAHVPARPTPRRVEALLRARQPELVTYAGWEAIDRHERALGEPTGRPRVKLTRIEEMLRGRRRRRAVLRPRRATDRSRSARLSPAGPVSSSGRAPDF